MTSVTRDYSKYIVAWAEKYSALSPIEPSGKTSDDKQLLFTLTDPSPVNPVNTNNTNDVIEQDDNYCERCGRLNTCSKIYVCEIRTDFNGYDLPCDMDVLHRRWLRPQELLYETEFSDEELSDESSAEELSDESSAEETSDESSSEEEDEEDVVDTKCW